MASTTTAVSSIPPILRHKRRKNSTETNDSNNSCEIEFGGASIDSNEQSEDDQHLKELAVLIEGNQTTNDITLVRIEEHHTATITSQKENKVKEEERENILQSTGTEPTSTKDDVENEKHSLSIALEVDNSVSRDAVQNECDNINLKSTSDELNHDVTKNDVDKDIEAKHSADNVLEKPIDSSEPQSQESSQKLTENLCIEDEAFQTINVLGSEESDKTVIGITEQSSNREDAFEKKVININDELPHPAQNDETDRKKLHETRNDDAPSTSEERNVNTTEFSESSIERNEAKDSSQIQESKGILRRSLRQRRRSASVDQQNCSIKEDEVFSSSTRRIRSLSEAHNVAVLPSSCDPSDPLTFDDSNNGMAESKRFQFHPRFNQRNTINERRLPSKKRKASHDLSVQLAVQVQKQPKGSSDLSVTFEDDQNIDRKGSYDFSINYDDTIRLRADSTASMVFDILLAPRKYSNDTNNSAMLPCLGEPPVYNSKKSDLDIDDNSSSLGDRSNHHTSQLDMSALEQFDVIACKHDEENKISKDINHDPLEISGPPLSGVDDKSIGSDTFASSGHRLLLEAIMMTTGSAASTTGIDRNNTGEEAVEYTSTTLHSQQHADPAYIGRDRLESWGGMSDLSLPMANLLGSWQHPEFNTTNESPSAEQVLFLDEKDGAVPTRIMLAGRDRLNSLASMSEASLGMGGPGQSSTLGVNSNLDDSPTDIAGEGDIQEYVAAAMASIGDQLAELACAVENAATTDSVFDDNFNKEFGFDEESSTADTTISQPLIGAVSDALVSRTRQSRSWSISSEKLSVDYDAVQAAVDAAEAASGSLGLTSSIRQKDGDATTKTSKIRPVKRKLPLKRNLTSESSSSSCSESKNPDLSQIRQRARAAAGVDITDPVPSNSTPAAVGSKSAAAPKKAKKKSHLPPIKKRVKRNSLTPDGPIVSSNVESPSITTPRVSNKYIMKTEDLSDDDLPDAPISNSKGAKQQAKQQGQSNQKWESMFECLVEFVQERRLEDTANFSEKEKEEWIWDGNVPTTYKSSDGKALGRWVNNQRSAKSKGSLKDDREVRLINVGLKWSVLASNSWNLMLDELTLYINEQAAKGSKWDGNVPTNYQIKTRPDSYFAGEDKNLGRWVNRQRSMYQAGKLRKDRQLDLEKIGLKWSMLATTSWDSMYETLVEYVEQQKKLVKTWDGNVPANYRTDDNPPRSLGRWINRQRSAFMKHKLKQEYVDKLNILGLKWSVHHRHGENDGENDIDDGDSDSDADNKSNEGASVKSISVNKVVRIADSNNGISGPDKLVDAPCLTTDGINAIEIVSGTIPNESLSPVIGKINCAKIPDPKGDQQPVATDTSIEKIKESSISNNEIGCNTISSSVIPSLELVHLPDSIQSSETKNNVAPQPIIENTSNAISVSTKSDTAEHDPNGKNGVQSVIKLDPSSNKTSSNPNNEINCNTTSSSISPGLERVPLIDPCQSSAANTISALQPTSENITNVINVVTQSVTVEQDPNSNSDEKTVIKQQPSTNV